MKTHNPIARMVLAASLAVLVAHTLGWLRADESARQIPDPLKPWEGWATWDDKERNAPKSYQDANKAFVTCPSGLNLSVDKTAGQFDLTITVFTAFWVALPGSDEVWPLEVKSNGTPIAVVEHQNNPSVYLPPGVYHLTGSYRWDEMPEKIVIPQDIGVLSLQVEGKPMEAATWDANGFLWLKRDQSEATDKNFLGVKVYRMIEDGIPMWLHTQVELSVAGKSREEDLKSILPEGWQLANVDSPIPVAIDEAGHMKAQVRAGKWIIHLDAFHQTPATGFAFASGATPTSDEELVAFKAAPDFRMAEVQDIPSIDVSQTTFPDEWHSFPVYHWETATPFHLVERMRGMGLQKPEGLTISRQLWMDEDGQRLVFLDQLTGQRQQTWRLDVADNEDLGSVRSNGQAQLITRNPGNGASGVEVRSRDLNLQAAGRMDRAKALSATGWRTDADSLRVALNLPPGWRLFALFGADWVQGDWLTAWSLLDLFLLLIFALAVHRLYGLRAGVLAFIAFGLAYQEPGAPRLLWLVLLIPLGLLKVVPGGWARGLVTGLKYLLVAILVVNLVPFVAGQIRQALYPQLEGTEAALRVFQTRPVNETVAISNGNTVTYGLPGAPNNLQYNGGNTYTGATTLNGGNLAMGNASAGQMAAGQNDAAAWNNSGGVVTNNGNSSSYTTLGAASPNAPVAQAAAQAATSEQAAENAAPGNNNQVMAADQAQLAQAEPQSAPVLLKALQSARSVSKGNLAYDAKVRIQTGPGVPEWRWRTVSFGWNGPVQASQKVYPILIPLGLERLLTVLRVVLLIALAWVLLDASRIRVAFSAKGRIIALTAALLALGLGLATPARAQNQIPDKETLSTLHDRLLETPDAYPTAADIPMVSLSLRDKKVVMDAEIDAAIPVAVPLPGRLPAWSPVTVLVDGSPNAALSRDDGYLWIALPAGVHKVHLEGLLPDVTEWEWTFQLKPRHVVIDAPDWSFTGVRPDGIPEQQIFFTLKQKSTGTEASYERQELHTIAALDRHLELGLVWQVHNEVTRLSPANRAISIRVPLLPGEKVLTSNLTPVDGMLDVRLGANESSFTWDSELPVTDKLSLATRPDDAWIERWYLVASPIWNVTISGLDPVFEPGAPDLVPVWHPWPGEKTDLALTRPEPLGGATVTVHNVRHDESIGSRQRTSQLELHLQCSLGQDFGIGLPPEANITTLTQNGVLLPARKRGDRLMVSLQPGEQNIVVGWKTDTALKPYVSTDLVSLPVESANITTVLHVPTNRWVLWTHGPLRGPAVQFWIIVICSLIGAQIAARLKGSPLTIGQWTLLGLGLTQVQLGALIVVAWFFVLVWRGTESFQKLGFWLYNLMQLVLLGLTVMVFVLLLGVLKAGFLGRPDMFIEGNGSSAYLLQWYQAQAKSALPLPGCLSVSIWWYRLLMLAWALWLASSLIRWLTWAWGQFSKGGLARHWPWKRGASRKNPEKTSAPPALPT